jgi:hypothetical protein
MKALLVLVIAAAAMTAAAVASSKDLAASCVAPSVRASADYKHYTAVGGSCGKQLSVVSHQLVGSDQTGTACGKVVTRSGRKANVSSVPYTVRVRFGIAPRSTPRRITWARWRDFATGSIAMQCGRLSSGSTLPSATKLCAWDGPVAQIPGHQGACGVPLSRESAWAGPAQLVGNTVTAGAVASPASPCSYAASPKSITWFTSDPIVASPGLSCPGSFIAVGLWALALGHYENGDLVIDCSTHSLGIGALSFQIPQDWGGVLMTSFVIVGTGPYESQNSVFQLSGSRSGCPLPAHLPLNG